MKELARMRELLTRFLTATEANVLEMFMKLPGAVTNKAGDYVFVPGKRSDRILLVAHADTVSYDVPKIVWIGDAVMRADSSILADAPVMHGYSKSWGNALGADDRAGCAMLWDLFNGQHSLLITTGEETGGNGAKIAARRLAEELSKHSFAIEVDRRGFKHAVFYDVATKPFKQHILGLLNNGGSGWAEQQGSFTDISHLCPGIGLCGVNLSAGYLHEHGETEVLLLGAWMETRAALCRVLRMPKHVRFELPPALPKAQYSGGGVSTVALSNGSTLTVPVGKLSKKSYKKLLKRIASLERKAVVTASDAAELREKLKVRFNAVQGATSRVQYSRTVGAIQRYNNYRYCDHGKLWEESCTQCDNEWDMPNPRTFHDATGYSFTPDPHDGYAPVNGLIVRCFHWCRKCDRIWHHMKQTSGKCLLIHEAECPTHNEHNLKLVRQLAPLRGSKGEQHALFV